MTAIVWGKLRGDTTTPPTRLIRCSFYLCPNCVCLGQILWETQLLDQGGGVRGEFTCCVLMCF